MRRYAFINKDGNINGIIGWQDGRELSSDYTIPDGIIVKEINDDAIDNSYYYDNASGTFLLKQTDEKEVAKNQILSQLAELDNVLPRCVEDMISSLGMDVTKLPQIMQDRLKQKQDLRVQLQVLNS